MHLIHAVILGIVEGITEFLPISSTGHLILTSDLLRLAQTDFLKSFEIIIQLGAILAVVVLYWKKLWNWQMIKKLLVAVVPTGVIGLILYKTVKQYLLGNNQIVLWSLLLGGLVLILFEYFHTEDSESNLEDITYKQAFVVGLFQAVAIIPGVSRAAATIVGGLLLGINRRTIVEFSFLLAIPTMVAASGLDLYKNYETLSDGPTLALAIGFITAFLAAVVSIKYFLRFIQHHKFTGFGVYRVIAAIIFWIFV